MRCARGWSRRSAEADGDEAVKAVVIVCQGQTFFAGADITEFGKPMLLPMLPTVVDIIENCTKPVVAAIHGTAFGGGLEVALASHYRVAVPSAKLGVPEVKLGLLPGAGGTQRLPRVAGVEKALEMAATGNPIGATEAHAIGLVDRLIEGDLEQHAVAFAEEVKAIRPIPKSTERDDKLAGARANPQVFADFRKANARKFRGFEAPEKNIQAIEAAVAKPYAEGVLDERRLFMELMTGKQARAQQYFFFAERKAAKIDGIPEETRAARDQAGRRDRRRHDGRRHFDEFPLRRHPGDDRRDAAGGARPRHRRDPQELRGDRRQGPDDRRTGRGRDGAAQPDARPRRPRRLRPDHRGGVREYGGEEGALRQARRDRQAGRDPRLQHLLSLDRRDRRRSTTRPEDVVGLHFFSPANIMKLLEVVRGAKTQPDVLVTAMQLAKRIKKVAVVAGVCYGFIGNRMLIPRQMQAMQLLLEGATPEQVDRVHVEFGMPMGPFQMSDLAGVDIGWHRDPARIENIRDALCAIDRWGQKKGAGFYDYDEKRNPSPSPVVQGIIDDFRAKAGVEKREISDQEIIERTLYTMVNEGALILEDGYGPARVRHRCRLGLWLWLAGLSRRPDALGGQRGAGQDRRRDPQPAAAARGRFQAVRHAGQEGRGGREADPLMALCLLTPEAEYDVGRAEWMPQAASLEHLFAARGLKVSLLPWSTDDDLSNFALTIPLMAWGYHRDMPRWLAQLDRWAATGAQLVNPLHVLRWNADKAYLLDFERRGIRIVPSRVAHGAGG